MRLLVCIEKLLLNVQVKVKEPNMLFEYIVIICLVVFVFSSFSLLTQIIY